MSFGKGLRSIRTRFTLLLVAELVAFAVLSHWIIDAMASGHDDHASTLPSMLFGALLVLPFAAVITFRMTKGLTQPIEELKRSTDAIARGDFETEVNVDCECEIGGLADSFRTMVDRLNANVAKINKLAFEDAVTGLPNRAVISSITSEHTNLTGSLLFIDLDHFKKINDTLGHSAGDCLLKMAAERIMFEIAPDQRGDVLDLISPAGQVSHNHLSKAYLFRFAGDEFVLLWGGQTNEDEIADLGQKIISALEQPFDYMHNRVRIGATIGISIFGKDSNDPEEIIKFADIAMYNAKNDGRGRLAFFDDSMRQSAEERSRLEGELRDALDQHQFVMHYQPKLDVKSGACVGVEALVRWNHPRLGLLYPGSFMDMVEASQLVGRLGQEVMRLVAQQAKGWTSHGIETPIAINVCPSLFLNPEFVDHALGFIKSLDLDPRMIELELTETLAMQDPAGASLQLAKFAEAGVRVAIDDFGVGYSNLAQLYQLPFHSLKLDRSLIEHIAEDDRSRTIVKTTIEMAHALGHTIVAEGVETAEQAITLAKLNCDEVQGFYFARPMPAQHLQEWIVHRKAA